MRNQLANPTKPDISTVPGNRQCLMLHRRARINKSIKKKPKNLVSAQCTMLHRDLKLLADL